MDFVYPGEAAENMPPEPPPIVDAGGIETSTVALPAVRKTTPGGEADAQPASMDLNVQKRLVIYTADFSILVTKVEDSMAQLREMIDEWGGHIQTADLSQVTFRIPAAKFDLAVKMVSQMGVVMNKQLQAEDVTNEYRDVQLRIEVAEESRKRMMAILKNADKMKDIIEIEKEIRRLTEEIERMKGQLRVMADRIVYSTITVKFQAKAPTPRQPAAQRPRRESSYFYWINQLTVESVAGYFGRRTQPSGWFPPFKMPKPEKFVRVGSEKDWDFRALTPEEDKLLVRRYKVTELGSLDFWVNAVRSQFVDERGYTLIDEGELKTDAGLVGHRFTFELSLNEVPYVHEIVLFVTQTDWWFLFRDKQHIYAAAFMCEKKNYDEHKAAVEKALKGFVSRRGSPLAEE